MSQLDDQEIAELSIDLNVYYSDEDIQRRLSNLPRLRHNQGAFVINAYSVYKEAEAKLKRETAKQHLIARRDSELTSEADRKAWALTQDPVVKAETEVLTAEIAYKNEQLKYDALDDIFTAVRKLANMRMAENEDQRNHDKYNRTEGQ